MEVPMDMELRNGMSMHFQDASKCNAMDGHGSGDGMSYDASKDGSDVSQSGRSGRKRKSKGKHAIEVAGDGAVQDVLLNQDP
jgi:hypothetical protein